MMSKMEKSFVVIGSIIQIGYPVVLITQDNKKFQTSEVVNFKLDGYGNISIIETKNTIYHNVFSEKKDVAYTDVIDEPVIGESCTLVRQSGEITRTSMIKGIRWNPFDQGYEIATQNSIYKRRGCAI